MPSRIKRYGELSKEGRRAQAKAARAHLGAAVTIHGAGALTPEQRTDLAGWLHRTADELVTMGDRYTSGRWRGRWFR